MKGMEVNFVFNIDFAGYEEKHYAKMGVKNGNGINALYVYNNKEAYINLGADEYKRANTRDLIKLISTTIAHETIHHAIHAIVGSVADSTNKESKGEEKVVELMVGQRRWKKK